MRVAAPAARPHPTSLVLTWLGHATTLLELDGARLLTDPVLRARLAHLLRTGHPAAALEPVDAILLSHTHRDHLDLPSLRLLPRAARVVCPRGAGALLAPLGFRDVLEVVEGDEVQVSGVRVAATHAEHPGGRGPRARGPAALGYLVRGSLSAYFAGDTDLFPGMAALEPALDLALLPVSGWGPTLPPGHLDPERAARALVLLAPRVAVPIHWGTLRPFYRVRPYAADSSAGERFAALARELAPAVQVRVLPPGGRLTVERFIRTG